ncbi:MAG: type I DNA topoisomerase [Candidatus Colwellbacteria bacterium]|nr:type I DNA topoisomerase [Candidatus Colwellbacteria bacterium]
MKLVIVESPTKANTIRGFLGKDFVVESSYGHIRDLPKGKLGVDETTLEPQYVIPTKSRKTINNLKKAAAGSDEVILATDEDREGEAIAWHLAQALKLGSGIKTKRIVFHEITRSAIEEAIKKPRTINKDLVDAQQARRVIDRLVGYKLSPFLWKKVRGGLSAGRVQSAALKLIVDREQEIKSFTPQEYWTVKGLFGSAHGQLEAELVGIGHKKLNKFDIASARDAQLLANDIQKSSAQVADISKKEVIKKPLPPFITSTLQQDASRKLGFSAKKTMLLSQRLYEGGFITYMRTDSVHLSRESSLAAKVWLEKDLGSEYGKSAPRAYRSKSKLAQEAHEAIRPTKPDVTPERITAQEDEKKLYGLIWKRFMASQMPDARSELTTVNIKANGARDQYQLRTSSTILKFDGFQRIWPSQSGNSSLPELKKNEPLKVLKTTPEQHFTEAPPRYNEASLIKSLEEFGIGRPSTYAPIISVIQDRGYVAKDQNRRFLPEEIGVVVNQILAQHFPNIVNIDFTAKMEEKFDEVANGFEEWRGVVAEFYGPFLKNLTSKYDEVKKTELIQEKTDVKCEQCGRQMIIKFGRFGKFMACPGYPDCKNTKNLKEPAEKLGLACPKCPDGEIVTRRTKRGRLFYGCNRYPACDYASWKDPRGNKETKS